MPQKTYTVVKDFVDSTNKQWKAGAKFTGDEQAAQTALRAGNIKEEQPADPNQPQE